MVNQAIQREIGRTSKVTNTGVRGRHVVTLAVVIAAAVAVATLNVSVDSSDATDPAVRVQVEAARWQALVAAEYPAATAGVKAQTERLTALAAAYGSGAVLPGGALADSARWQGLADSYTRTQRTETARWAGLAAHHTALTKANQAWADRYQGLADATG